MERRETGGARSRGARLPAAIAGLLAAGIVLTGCGASGDGGTADRSAKESRPTAPALPDGGRGGTAHPEEDGRRPPSPAPDHLSTFALDVDTASYGYARRALAEGRLPDPATVRPEEFVNSFRPDYERPADDGFGVTLDGARTGRDGWSLVRVGLATRGADRGGERPPAALTFVVDVSGSTEAEAILARIGEERREYGITLFGVGSEFGDAFMEGLADRGDGQTTYVSSAAQARKVFVDQLPAHVELRARDAKAQVAFDRRTVEKFRLIGYENREVADEDFRNDRVDGGEIGAGHTVTALYAVRTRPGATGTVATATVRWLDPATRAPRERSGTVATGALTADVWGGGHDSLQLTAIAAYFADVLRGGSLPGTPALGTLARHADAIAERSGSAVVRELAESVRRAETLRGPVADPSEPGGTGEGELRSGDPYS
ncbi:YfbK domain-containing protein [Streptomyces sp. NPDC000963]